MMLDLVFRAILAHPIQPIAASRVAAVSINGWELAVKMRRFHNAARYIFFTMMTPLVTSPDPVVGSADNQEQLS